MKKSTRALLWGGAGLLFATAVTGGLTKTATPTGNLDNLDMVRAIAAEAGLTRDWQDFLAMVSWGEAKGNTAASNLDANEAKKAGEAFDRNQQELGECGYQRSSYVFGSGGWFGFLPAVGVLQLGKHNRCIDPKDVFDPRVATAMAVGFANGLMGRDGFRQVPTWRNLRAMWGWPAKGGDLAYLAKKRPRHDRHARELGLGSAWLDQPVPPLKLTGAQALENLGES